MKLTKRERRLRRRSTKVRVSKKKAKKLGIKGERPVKYVKKVKNKSHLKPKRKGKKDVKKSDNS